MWNLPKKEREARIIYNWYNQWGLDKLFMKLYKKKGGKGTFACREMQLTDKDLDYLIKVILYQAEERPGFPPSRPLAVDILEEA